MRIAIIGAGISGLSVGQLLRERHEVTLFESENRPGGMIKCDRVNGHLFHRTGGHVFNTRRQEVIDFFWSFFSRDNEFIKADRKSGVSMDGNFFVSYPIENHISVFDDNVVNRIITDWMKIKTSEKDDEPKNFEEFLIKRFGITLYEMYFCPYNEKIWRRDLKKVPLSWLEGKLPMPSVEEMVFNNIKKIEEKKFVHSTFFYAKHNGSQFIADRFAERLDIRYGKKIEQIKCNFNVWNIDGEEFDKVVFCGNIKQLPSMLGNLSDAELYMIVELESHGTTTVLCEIDDNPYSWSYMPSKKHTSHRIICTGNFSPSNRAQDKMSATIEFTDYISKEEILDNLTRIPWNPKYLAHHYEKYTYPIQGKETRKSIQELRNRLENKGFYLCGRFAEWEYYNTDVCMASAISLCEKLKKE